MINEIDFTISDRPIEEMSIEELFQEYQELSRMRNLILINVSSFGRKLSAAVDEGNEELKDELVVQFTDFKPSEKIRMIEERLKKVEAVLLK